jgi:hypothetical protein
MKDERQILVGTLCFVYRMIVASEPLLELACTKAEGDLLDYYRKHLEEEHAHDEMLKDDLGRLGVQSIPHFHSAAAVAGSQYYFLLHDDPALLLGYMRALESNAMSVASVDSLSARHGTELRALRHHAEHDPGHKADLDAMIAALEPDLRARVEWNEANVRDMLARVRV